MGYVSREVQIVLLCEDGQHQVFVTRFLESTGRLTRKAKHRLRVEKASQGRGSAEQFVRERFPKELAAYRSQRNLVSVALVVMPELSFEPFVAVHGGDQTVRFPGRSGGPGIQGRVVKNLPHGP